MKDNEKDTNLYKDFKSFIEKYFLEKVEDKNTS